MGPRDYRFRSVWSIEAPLPTVFGVLVDLGAYPDWWADVRDVHEIDEDTAELTCRATLPYTIVLRMVRIEENADAGRLRVRLDIGQVVCVRKPLLRALSPLARPVLRANHALMMRHGQRGLRAHLR